MTGRRKPLEPWQREDARRLKSLFNKRSPKLSQADFAVDFDIGETQGSVSQYLNGTIPLNIKVLLKFCRGLRVQPDEISPRLAQEISNAGVRIPTVQQSLPIYATAPERQARLLELFDKLRREQQEEALQNIEATAQANEAILRELGPRFKIAPNDKVARHLHPAGPPRPINRRVPAKRTKD